jgi:hypothetical protein
MFSKCPSLFPGPSLLLKVVRKGLSVGCENKARGKHKLRKKNSIKLEA